MLQRTKDHKYVNTLLLNHEYQSVTKVLETYKDPVPQQYWAWVKAVEALMGPVEYKAKRPHWKPDEMWLSEQSHLLGWEKVDALKAEILQGYGLASQEGLLKGTLHHDAEETKDLKNKQTLHDLNVEYLPVKECQQITPEGNISWPVAPADLIPGYVYLEYGLCLDRFAGTADWVYPQLIQGAKFISIKDHKTDKKFTMSNGLENLLYPVNHLQNCSFNRYALQLSFYAYMFEQQGYIVKDLWVINNTAIKVLPYLRKEIISILEHQSSLLQF